MHSRLAELLSYLDLERSRVLRAAAELPPEKWTVSPGEARWSVSDVCWHLQRVESGVAKLIRKRTTEPRDHALPAEDNETSLLGALDGRGVTSRAEAWKAPPQVSPTETLDAETVQALLEDSRRMMRSALADVDGLAIGAIRHPHPVLGDLDLYQWILFVGHHEARHVGQITETVEAVKRQHAPSHSGETTR